MGIGKRIIRLFSLSDEQAMWRVRQDGDPQAFAQLVHRWEIPVQRLCTRMTGDLHLGEDLAQEVFSRIYQKRGLFPAEARFSTWLWRVALNLCYDELRRRKQQWRIGDPATLDRMEEFVAEGPSPDACAAASDEAARVRDALLRLPEIYRVVVVLRHYEGLKLQEIARVLEIPEGTVKSRLADGLDQLKGRLTQKGLTSWKPQDKPQSAMA